MASSKDTGVGYNCSDYAQACERWERTRAVIDGEDAVKAEGQEYLPKLGGQEATEYDAYLQRACFFPATSRTLGAIIGMMFREPPKIQGTAADSEQVKSLEASISPDGKPLQVFVKRSVEEVMTTGRVGIMLDLPKEEMLAPRPNMAMYRAESIVNWRTSMIGGKRVLSMVVLEETSEEETGEFERAAVLRRRVLSLSSMDDQGNASSTAKPAYTVAVWRWKKTDSSTGTTQDAWVMELPPKQIKIRGQTLAYIPFVCINVNDLSMDVCKPPLYDMALVNLSHYRTYADLEHGRHFTALPTPWAAGFDVKKNQVLKIGSQTAWVADDPHATCGFLEYTGQGLAALENALKDKQDQMAILGARMLQGDKAAVEAADTQRVRHASENNITMSVAETVEAGMTQLLKWACEWMALSTEISVELNKEYMDYAVNPETLKEMSAAVITGTLSWDTFFYNLQRAGLMPDKRTSEEEKALIEAGGFAPPPPGAEPPGGEVLPFGKPKAAGART